MSLEDNIAAQIRFDVRQLHLFAENYKIQQKVVESLYSQVENALEVIVAPVDPDSLRASGTAGQANAAALTNQYLGALGNLNGSQARMYDVWLSLLATRMELYLNLERLPLDNRGVWMDDPGPPPPPPCASAETLANPSSGHLKNGLSGNPACDVGGATLGQPVAPNERGPIDILPPPRLLAPAAP